MQPADTNMDARAKLKALVSRSVDEALARRIDDELSELPDLSRHQRIGWLVEILARRDGIVAEVLAKAGRMAAEPDAGSHDLQ